MKKQKSNQEYILLWTGARILKLNIPINSNLTDEEMKEQVFTALLNEFEAVYNMECPIKYSEQNIQKLINLIKEYKPDNIDIIHTNDKLTIKTKDE